VRDIVLEQITIRLPARSFQQMPGLVRPLLMNDLPNHLFWAAAWPRDEAQFDAMAGLCDHLVVDSRLFVDAPRDLAVVQARRDRGQRITDLAWLRLRPWRRALAEAFERLPWRTGTAVSGTIRHGRASASAAQLLKSWLDARLGSRMQLDASGDHTLACPDHVELATGGFQIELVAPRQQIRVHVSTPEHCYLPFSVPRSRGTDSDLLAAAIDLG
jgi:glucose-6-phosphate dehydrogenase assembly protein OpcA